jgi:triacylglycerol lipase
MVPNAVKNQVALTTYSGKPSVGTRVSVLALRVITNLLGVDFATQIAPLMARHSPPYFTTRGLKVGQTEYDGWKVLEVASSNPSGKCVVAVHGGAFVIQPTFLHWFDYAQMARDTGARVVVPIYPLAGHPGGNAATVVPQTGRLIASKVDQYGADNVSVYGDSAGGTIALAALQHLVRQGETDQVPSHTVLISPALDLTYSNPHIALADDPALKVDSAKMTAALWADGQPLVDPLVSPLYGSLAGLPPTVIYSGSLEILAPDTLKLQDGARGLGGANNFTFVLRNGTLHNWAQGGLPINRAAVAVRPDIYRQLGVTT